jgi:hypothetical protein
VENPKNNGSITAIISTRNVSKEYAAVQKASRRKQLNVNKRNRPHNSLFEHSKKDEEDVNEVNLSMESYYLMK